MPYDGQFEPQHQVDGVRRPGSSCHTRQRHRKGVARGEEPSKWLGVLLMTASSPLLIISCKLKFDDVSDK